MGIAAECQPLQKQVVSFMQENVGTFTCAADPSNTQACSRPLRLDLARKMLPEEAIALCCLECPTYIFARMLLTKERTEQMSDRSSQLEPLSH